MVVAVVEAGQLYFVRTDHIGRPIFAADTLGTKVWEASYLPFGGVQTSTGANSELGPVALYKVSVASAFEVPRKQQFDVLLFMSVHNG